jgi:hypothetical protein
MTAFNPGGFPLEPSKIPCFSRAFSSKRPPQPTDAIQLSCLTSSHRNSHKMPLKTVSYHVFTLFTTRFTFGHNGDLTEFLHVFSWKSFIIDYFGTADVSSPVVTLSYQISLLAYSPPASPETDAAHCICRELELCFYSVSVANLLGKSINFLALIPSRHGVFSFH